MVQARAKGTATELLVAYELEARGFPVSKPLGEQPAYDLIVDCRGHLARVQVKSAYVPSTREGERVRYQITVGRPWQYTERVIEFVVGVVCLPSPVFLIVPIEFLEGASSLNYFPDDPTHGTGVFAGAWDIFERFGQKPANRVLARV